MYSDFHLHSEFSDDSRTPMEVQIEKAISLGMQEMCFTDHVDYGIKNDWSDEEIKWRGGDGIGTAKDELDPLTNVNYPEYFLKLDRMQKTYGKKITIRKGLEFGIQTITVRDYERLLENYGDQLDFVLLSMHEIDNKELWTGEFMEGMNQKEYNLKYYTEILNVMKVFHDYDVLAHLDLVSRYDAKGPIAFEEVKDILTEILTTAIKDGKGIEINTSSWHYGLKDTTPSRDILKLYHDLGGKIITIGSDAHKQEFLGDHFKDAGTILKETGFTEYCTFEKHQVHFHAL
ncbi:MAG: histidinol-phosphatase HisJ family protein [Bulleidia sp.]|nr:histidinol-phosphatase HisJ family protein [Bulleidia sp.]